MKQNTITKFEVTTTSNGWGNITTYHTNIGEFNVMRKDNDYNGNPVYIVAPQGYITELPKIKFFRRNNNKGHYTTQSYNIDDEMDYFLNKLFEQLEKGNRLYVNFPMYIK